MSTRPSSTAPARDAGTPPGREFTGTDFLWILLSVFLIVLLMNAGLYYFANDRVSDFRSLIDALCV
ncbi:MAG TPA: hypothetical protein VLV76_19765 [Candidatus Acidoferrum sp.]|nr:hypothetical protein [Candidatus Acidoferrum sp.]